MHWSSATSGWRRDEGIERAPRAREIRVSREEDPGPGTDPAREIGYAKLSNCIRDRGILAHLPGDALKVYIALLLAGRRDTGTCFPTIKTLCRWTGLSRQRVSKAMAFLMSHKLVDRFKRTMGGKPRRMYLVAPPDMMPDHRATCEVCNKKPDHRATCIRDERTGRLIGKSKREVVTDHRYIHKKPDHRYIHKKPDHRATNHSEPDITIRKGETHPDGALRSLATPEGADSLRAPDLGGGPNGGAGPIRDPDLAAAAERAHRAVLRRNGKDSGEAPTGQAK